jgi:hypothetical protein
MRSRLIDNENNSARTRVAKIHTKTQLLLATLQQCVRERKERNNKIVRKIKVQVASRNSSMSSYKQRKRQRRSSTIAVRLRLHPPHSIPMRAIELASPHSIVDSTLTTALLFFLLRMAHLTLPTPVDHVLTSVSLDNTRRLLGLHVCFQRLAPLIKALRLLDGGG